MTPFFCFLISLLLQPVTTATLAQPLDAARTRVIIETTTATTHTSETAKVASLSEREKIEYLLRRIGQSGNTFVRGGTEYPPDKAESHLRMKLGRAGKRVRTARDFIKYLASTSSATGNPYLIKKPDGTRVPAGQWLTEELEKLEAAQKPPAQP